MYTPPVKPAHRAISHQHVVGDNSNEAQEAKY